MSQGALFHTSDQPRGAFDLKSLVLRHDGLITYALKRGSLLYSQGQPADSLFYVGQGRIHLTVVGTLGREAIIGVLEGGDLCGEGCLAGECIRASAATCVADCVVTRMEAASAVRALQQDPEFAEACLTYFLNRTVRLTERLISQLFDSSEQRLARILLLLSNYGKNGRRAVIIRNLDQEALAQMIGTSRSRVNHFMNKFRDLGYIDYRGDIVVHSSLLNVVLGDVALGSTADQDRAVDREVPSTTEFSGNAREAQPRR
jgi:CRP/FNR family transcriptional regulator, cyclic AMP receptor protein